MNPCSIYLLTALISVFSPLIANAAAPNLKTPEPVIYLEDNLDEKDSLGWCIDTKGRGLSDRLHAHSCKPQGGDVQFRFDETSGQIQSATFEGKCAQLLAAPDKGTEFALVECATDNQLQHFDYDSVSMEFRPKGAAQLCIIIGDASRSAGPFMSRDLVLANCTETQEKHKRWIIKP